MEKFISEFICDFCGVKCKREGYVFPIIKTETQYAKDTDGKTVAKFDKPYIASEQVDMCQTCKVKVARFINLAHYVDIQKIEDGIYDAIKQVF